MAILRAVISIHAPSRERQIFIAFISDLYYFNPRSLTGATSVRLLACPETSRISIHAPSRERLEPPPALGGLFQYFNPRSLTGATDAYLIIYDITINFNPRSLTGATGVAVKPNTGTSGFQSTLPHGSDPAVLISVRLHHLISIHAPSRERPKLTPVLSVWHAYFNPRSLTGATFIIHFYWPSLSAFQSTLPHGSDPVYCVVYVRLTMDFNPRSLTGATVLFVQLDAGFDYFNPRSLTGATSSF